MRLSKRGEGVFHPLDALGRWCVVILTFSLILEPSYAGRVVEQISTVAGRLYPGHILLPLAVSSTSRLQAALDAAVQHHDAARSDDSSSSPAIVLLLQASSTRGSSKGQQLTVDAPLFVDRPGLRLVLITEAAVRRQAAAAAEGASEMAAAEAAAVPPEDLVPVACQAAETADPGVFIRARGFASLELRGLSVSGCPSTAIVAVEGGSLLLADFELLKNSRKGAAVDLGGALMATAIEQVELHRVVCYGNANKFKGGCLFVSRVQTLTLADSLLTFNMMNEPQSDGGGGAVAVELAGTVAVERCIFAKNTAIGQGSEGGGLNIFNSGRVLIRDSLFLENSATSEGGGIFASDVGRLELQSCNFTDNGQLPLLAGGAAATPGAGPAQPGTAMLTARGAGISVQGQKTSAGNAINVVIVGCRFTGNAVSGLGAGLHANQWGRQAARIEIQDSYFANNSASLEGGAVYLNENYGSRVLLANTLFLDNTAAVFGGAISVYDSDVTATNCSFDNNRASSDGGAIQLQTNIAAGSRNALRLIGTSLTNNTSESGLGGAAAVDTQGLLMQDSRVLGNVAGTGGGLSAASAWLVSINDSVISGNVAGDGAGGLAVAGADQVQLRELLLEANEGGQGGGLSLSLVSVATLAGVRLSGNAASGAGGGLSLLRVRNITLDRCDVSGNVAQVGGGLAAHSCSLQLSAVNCSDNRAVVAQQQTGDANQAVLAFASMLHTPGSAGCGLAQRSSLTLSSSVVSHNRADADAGGLLLQQPARALDVSNTSFQGNSAGAAGGAVVIRGFGAAEPAVQGSFSSCSFAGNAARGEAAGAVLVDAGLGALAVAFSGCEFSGNSAGKDGGGVAGVGAARVSARDCSASGNSAAGSGGWLSCQGCQEARVSAGSCSGNKAVQAGGCLSCTRCSLLQLEQALQCEANSAKAGGAVAVQSSHRADIRGCSVRGNTAVAPAAEAVAAADIAAAAAAAAPAAAAAASAGWREAGRRSSSSSGGRQLQLLGQLPIPWQDLYGASGAAVTAAGVDCGGGGSGGGICISDVAQANLTDCVISGNQGSTGGALFASTVPPAACAHQATADSSSSSSADAVDGNVSCNVTMLNLTVADNQALMAGGGLYTSTPRALLALDSAADADSFKAWVRYQHKQRLQQLAADNSVAAGGYGPGAASFPTQLAFMTRQQQAGFADDSGSGRGSNIGSGGGSNSGSDADAGAGSGMGRKLLQRQSGVKQQRLLQQQQAQRHQQGQQQMATRRQLLQHGAVSRYVQDTSQRAMKARARAISATTGAGGMILDPICPALGATVMDDWRVAVDSSQIFSLPVHFLDAFGSTVTSGPGSNWVASLIQPDHAAAAAGSSAEAAQLAGASRGVLTSGSLLMSDLSLTAAPGTDWPMHLTAVPQSGNTRLSVSTDVIVQVRPCLTGQIPAAPAAGSNSSASQAGASQTAAACIVCPVPTFSFSSYQDGPSSPQWRISSMLQRLKQPGTSVLSLAAEFGSGLVGSQAAAESPGQAAAATQSHTPVRQTAACSPCPSGGICLAGMLIPDRGFYQPHPRSATIRLCPNMAACNRSEAATINLQAMQCWNRRFINPHSIPDVAPYTAMQCSAGYAGPLCSSCFRPGRSRWVAPYQQLQQQLQQQEQQAVWQQPFGRRFTLALQPAVLPAAWPDFDPALAFGKSNGRCSSCPHPAVAWVGFLGARMLDMSIIALMAMLWMCLGWLSASSAAAAAQELRAAGQGDAASFRHTMMGPRLARLLTSGAGVSGVVQELAVRPLTRAVTRRLSTGFASFGSRGRRSNYDRRLSGLSSQAGGSFGASSAHSFQGGSAEFQLLEQKSSADGDLRQLTAGPGSLESALSLASSHDAAGAARGGSCNGRQETAAQDKELKGQTHSRSISGAVAGAAAAGRRSLHRQERPEQPASMLQRWRSGSKRQQHAGDLAAAAAAAAASPFQQAQATAAVQPHQEKEQQQQQHTQTMLQRLRQLPQRLLGRRSTEPQPPVLQSLGSALSQGSASSLPWGPAGDNSFSAAGRPSSLRRGGSGSSVFFNLARPLSMSWSTAVDLADNNQLLGQLQPCATPGNGQAAAAASTACNGTPQLARKQRQDRQQKQALLMIAVKHLACTAQVVLDAAQIAAVVLSQDLLFFLPPWAAAGLSGLIVTQAHTWQWVPFECLFGPGSAVAGAAVQSVLVMLLPVLYMAMLLPVLVLLRNAAVQYYAASTPQQDGPATAVAPAAAFSSSSGSGAAGGAGSSTARKPGCCRLSCCKLPAWMRLDRQTWPLVAAVAVASMGYCYSFFMATIVEAFSCMALSEPLSVAGEVEIPGTYWLSDLQLRCWAGVHIAVAAVALAIGLPLLLGYLLLLLVLSWPEAAAGSGEGQQQWQWRNPLFQPASGDNDNQQQQQRQQQQQQQQQQQHKPGSRAALAALEARNVAAAEAAAEPSPAPVTITAQPGPKAFPSQRRRRQQPYEGPREPVGQHRPGSLRQAPGRAPTAASSSTRQPVRFLPATSSTAAAASVASAPSEACSTQPQGIAAQVVRMRQSMRMQPSAAAAAAEPAVSAAPEAVASAAAEPAAAAAAAAPPTAAAAAAAESPVLEDQGPCTLPTPFMAAAAAEVPGEEEDDNAASSDSSDVQVDATEKQQVHQPQTQPQTQPQPQTQRQYAPNCFELQLHKLLSGLVALMLWPLQQLLQPLVRRVQRSTAQVPGLTGQRCAGLGVWNVQHRWWWWTMREVLKGALVLTATEMHLRGPLGQAMAVLLLVVAAATLAWQVQACNGTSMERLQFVAFCWLQTLALLVLLPTMPGVRQDRRDALGGFMLVLVALLVLQLAVVLAAIVWRCLMAARKLNDAHNSSTEAAGMPAAPRGLLANGSGGARGAAGQPVVAGAVAAVPGGAAVSPEFDQYMMSTLEEASDEPEQA